MVCAICLMEEVKEPTRLGCEHTFCFCCIMTWFVKGQKHSSSLYCPCCRAKVQDLMVRGRSFQSNPLRLLCNAYYYLYAEHGGFPTQEAAIQRLRASVSKFDDPEYAFKLFLLIRAWESAASYHDHVKLMRNLVPFIEEHFDWMKTLHASSSGADDD